VCLIFEVKKERGKKITKGILVFFLKVTPKETFPLYISASIDAAEYTQFLDFPCQLYGSACNSHEGANWNYFFSSFTFLFFVFVIKFEFFFSQSP
jgi:hypothetical protein